MTDPTVSWMKQRMSLPRTKLESNKTTRMKREKAVSGISFFKPFLTESVDDILGDDVCTTLVDPTANCDINFSFAVSADGLEGFRIDRKKHRQHR